MSTINGIGIKFLGFSDIADDGSCFVTKWVTFLYVPIIPLSRIQVVKNSTSEYYIIAKTKLMKKEVFKTYLFGWLLFPLFIFVPPLLLFLIADNNHLYQLIVGSIWTIFTIWKLWDWNQKRGL